MKKILIVLIILATVAISLPILANAQTTDAELNEYVCQKDKVTEARSVIYMRNCVIAIKTEKFLNKTDYDQFKEQLQKEICEKFDIDNVVITRSPKAMHILKEISEMSDSEKEEAIKKFIEHELERKPHNPILQPRTER